MKIDKKNKILFWVQLVCLLSVLVILQTSLLPLFLKPFLIPYLLWIPLFYFLLYKTFFESLSLLMLVTLLSSVFLPYHLTALFFIYLSGFILFLILKEIFLFRSIKSFLFLVFIFSFYFSFLIEHSSFFLKTSLSGHSIPNFFSESSLKISGGRILNSFFKSFMTSLSCLPAIPLFKKYLFKAN